MGQMAGSGLALGTWKTGDFRESAARAPADDPLMSSRRSRRYESPPDLRALLAQFGFSLARAERASGLSPGSLSRLLTGRRGRGLRLETVRRLSRGTRLRLGLLAETVARTIEHNEERQRRMQAAELARLEAQLR